MQVSYEFLSLIYSGILDHDIFRYAIIGAKAMGFIILIVHYFRLYFNSFNKKIGGLGAYDLVRPFIYILLLMFYTVLMNGLDDFTTSVESSFPNIDTYGKLTEKVESAKTESTAPAEECPPSSPEENTAIATASIRDYIMNPSLIAIKLLEFIVYLIDCVVFGFSLIMRFAFLFILRFLAPFAIVASIFEKYKEFFWNWLKVYLIVFFSVYVFFLINLFCDLFMGQLLELKIASPLPEVLNPISGFATMIMLCVVLAKTFLYGKSIQLMYKVYSSHK